MTAGHGQGLDGSASFSISNTTDKDLFFSFLLFQTPASPTANLASIKQRRKISNLESIYTRTNTNASSSILYNIQQPRPASTISQHPGNNPHPHPSTQLNYPPPASQPSQPVSYPSALQKPRWRHRHRHRARNSSRDTSAAPLPQKKGKEKEQEQGRGRDPGGVGLSCAGRSGEEGPR